MTALGMPLFAGWRALARPSTPQGAAALEVHRASCRGDVHVQSVAAAGMAPIEAGRWPGAAARSRVGEMRLATASSPITKPLLRTLRRRGGADLVADAAHLRLQRSATHS
ncbi:MAG: hypothetical protein R2713_12510 [Ilumatobacteraceae bacterium]